MSKHSMVRVGKTRRYAAAVGLSAITWALGAPGVAAADVPESTTAEVQPELEQEASAPSPESTGDIAPTTTTEPTAIDEPTSIDEQAATGADKDPVVHNSNPPPTPTDEVAQADVPPVATTEPIDSLQSPLPPSHTRETDTRENDPGATSGRHALRIYEDDTHENNDDTTDSDAGSDEATGAETPESPWFVESTEDSTSTPLEDVSSIPTTIGPAPDSAFSGTSAPTPVETALVVGTVGATTMSVRRAEGPGDTGSIGTAMAGAGADPDDRFVDPGDPDWYSAVVGADPPPGVTYSVPDDGTGIVAVHNDSDVDIAIISVFYPNSSSQGLVVVAPGRSHTIAAESGVAVYWVQAERREGAGQTIGRIVTIDSEAGPTVMVIPATEDRNALIPLQGSVIPDYAAEDPDDRFADARDGAVVNATEFADPEAAGVTYSVLDDDHVMIHNEGVDDIAVTRSTAGGQSLTFEVLRPGESGTYAAVPGSPVLLSVQAPRAADGSAVVLGSIVRGYLDRTPVSVSPGDGLPAIPLRGISLPENHAPAGELVLQPKTQDTRTATYVPDVIDVDGDMLTYGVYQQAERGAVTIGAGNTVTYTPTDPAIFHDGFVRDAFIVEVSDGRGGTALLAANVEYRFIDVDNAAPAVSTVGQQNDIGGGTWTVTVSDADNDRVTVGISGLPQYGEVYLNNNEDGTYTVSYVPDLVQAHRTAHQIQIVLRAGDGHGGTVDTPITVDVPFYNASPSATIQLADGATGNFVDTAVLDVDTFDDDGDAVEIVSVSTANGGTATLVDGKLVYTPKPATVKGLYAAGNTFSESYVDTVTVVVDDGHGGRSTVTRIMHVVNTTSIPWVDDGQGRVLVFSSGFGTELSMATSLLLNQPTNITRAREFVRVVGQSELAPDFASYAAMLARYERSLEPKPHQDPWNWANFDRPSVPNGAGTTPKHAKNGSRQDQLIDYIDSEYAGDVNAFVGDLQAWFLDPATAPDRIIGLISKLGIEGDRTALVLETIQVVDAIMNGDLVGTLSASVDVLAQMLGSVNTPLTVAIAANLTTWKYVFEQAAETDWGNFNETVQFGYENPGVVVEEVAAAFVKVGVDLGIPLVLQNLDNKLPKVPDLPIPNVLNWFR
ncbi:hypothetical protein R4P47_07625 [Rhodococcus sp. IEGM 1370]|uniref:Ig-like domain-containing protein n=1 Tax=Rhodococcus sp. IEGM 1370 TaxID=3082222 RepID=UPI0029546367|nr:hypothetical protein [Rhodococcus sp. IEGM 1370]MDV8076425.1 hypothetical protein [Rhodococcus sp. IEGM 1370]